jgi:hypothetical protein
MSNEETHVAIQLEGRGSQRTKPFRIPDEVAYFSISWRFEDRDGTLELFSLDSPQDSLEVLDCAGDCESVWYGTGQFFFAISSSSAWVINIVADEDQSGDVLETAVEEQPEASQRELARAQIGDWAIVTANYPPESFEAIRALPQYNFLDMLDRCYIIDATAATQLELNAREVSEIRAAVLQIDNIFRSVIPTVLDNFPQPASMSAPIDAKKYQGIDKAVRKAYMSVSNLLRKKQVYADYWFAQSGDRVQLFKFNAQSALDRSEARGAAMDSFMGSLTQANADYRQRKAFWDEGERRG